MAPHRHKHRESGTRDLVVIVHHLHPQAAQFVKLRYFTGLSVEEAAEMVGLSQSAAYKHWAYARAWLRRRMNAPGRSAGD